MRIQLRGILFLACAVATGCGDEENGELQSENKMSENNIVLKEATTKRIAGIGQVAQLEYKAWEALSKLSSDAITGDEKTKILKGFDVRNFSEPGSLFENELAKGIYTIRSSISSQNKIVEPNKKKVLVLIGASEFLMSELDGENSQYAIGWLASIWNVSVGPRGEGVSSEAFSSRSFWEQVLEEMPLVKKNRD